MAFKKPKYSKSEVSQTFNTKDLFGFEVDEVVKEEFAESAISFIRERTQVEQEDINGNSFTPYSAEYAEEKGVSRNDVDMFLEGDMLESMSSQDVSKNQIKVKIQSGVETLKAFNHNTGDTLPKRQFFGLTNDQAQFIANDIKDRFGLEEAEEEGEEEVTAQTLRDLFPGAFGTTTTATTATFTLDQLFGGLFDDQQDS